MSNQNGLTITPLDAWFAGELVELPSGRVIRMVYIDVLPLFQDENGDVPDVFAHLVTGGGQRGDVSINEAVKSLGEMLPRIIKACVIEPPVTDEPQPGKSIGVNQFTLEDKMFVFSQQMGGLTQTAAKFPQQQAGSVAAVSTDQFRRKNAE